MIPPPAAPLTCAIRRKTVVGTPEERVRQHLIQQLLTAGYPRHLVAVERQVVVHGKRRRLDLIVFGRNGKPWLLAECKAPNIAVDEATLAQALAYNSQHGAQWLVLSNGNQVLALHLPTGEQLATIPAFGG